MLLVKGKSYISLYVHVCIEATALLIPLFGKIKDVHVFEMRVDN